MGTGFFLGGGVKRWGRGVKHPSHLAPRLKKEQSYISTPNLGLRGLFQGKLFLYLYIETISYDINVIPEYGC